MNKERQCYRNRASARGRGRGQGPANPPQPQQDGRVMTRSRSQGLANPPQPQQDVRVRARGRGRGQRLENPPQLQQGGRVMTRSRIQGLANPPQPQQDVRVRARGRGRGRGQRPVNPPHPQQGGRVWAGGRPQFPADFIPYRVRGIQDGNRGERAVTIQGRRNRTVVLWPFNEMRLMYPHLMLDYILDQISHTTYIEGLETFFLDQLLPVYYLVRTINNQRFWAQRLRAPYEPDEARAPIEHDEGVFFDVRAEWSSPSDDDEE